MSLTNSKYRSGRIAKPLNFRLNSMLRINLTNRINDWKIRILHEPNISLDFTFMVINRNALNFIYFFLLTKLRKKIFFYTLALRVDQFLSNNQMKLKWGKQFFQCPRALCTKKKKLFFSEFLRFPSMYVEIYVATHSNLHHERLLQRCLSPANIQQAFEAFVLCFM